MGSEPSFSSPTTHPRFSKVQYSINSNSMLVREPIISKVRQVDIWVQKRQLVSHIYNSSSFFICKDYQIQQNFTCSDQGVFVGCYDGVFDTTLKEILKVRKQERQQFTQEEIWYFILFICKSLKGIYQRGNHYFLGNLHPNNILINRSGQYKLIVSNYSLSFPSLLDHFSEYQRNGDTHAFISPQMVGFLYSTKYADYPDYPKCINRQTSQAYCLGLTLLSMATLTQQIAKVYKKYAQPLALRRRHNQNGTSTIINTRMSESRNYQISINAPSISLTTSTDYLGSLLEKVKIKYSKVLYQLIVELTQETPDRRSTIDNVYDVLRPVEKSILKFDKGWIQKAQEEEIVRLADPSEKISKDICQKWARGQSKLLKEEEK